MGHSLVDLSPLLLLLLLMSPVYGASFYGDSYVHLRRVEASVHNLVHVRFLTSSQAGLLFLAAGHREYLLLELVSGHLQVRLDLGSGEHSLRFEEGIKPCDRKWHIVQLNHDGHNLTMTLDQHFHTSLSMPGPDRELGVLDGLFIGGAAALKYPYLHASTAGFRGCVDEVVFNEHNLLSSLRPYFGFKSVHQVSTGCDSQFSATELDPVSFSGPKSFLSLPPWEFPQERVFECELHPSSKEEDGVVLYTSGNQGEFLAVEIVNGHLVATVGNAEGSKVELRSPTNVRRSPTWYAVQLHLLPYSIRLKVDQESIKADLGLEPQVVHLKGALFLGGLDEKAHGEARRVGLRSTLSPAGGSFKGCLRDIKVNSQSKGLPQALITKDITVGCGAAHVQIMTTPSGPTRTPQIQATTAKPNITDKRIPNFLLLGKLEVDEGGRAPLEPKHIKVNLNFRKLGIHPSQFKFHIEKRPVYGRLLMDLSPDSDADLDKARERNATAGTQDKNGTFSMLDLWQGRVMYVHGGSEEPSDFFVFSVSVSSRKQIPGFLKVKHLQRFDITVTPVNDGPELSLPRGDVFTLPQTSKRQLTTDVLKVSDPDSSPTELVFSSLGDIITEAGHLEHNDFPRRAINLFTQRDLEEGKIVFVHSGVSTTRLLLRVSDGQKSSNTVVLRIVAVPLEYKVVNNTGLEVNQGQASVITTDHLAVEVNLADQTADVVFDITESPRYGQLQRLHSSGEWKVTTSFSQKLLEKERIRYFSTYFGLQSHRNVSDHFKCHISINAVATAELSVPVAVHWIRFKVTRSKVEVNSVAAVVVTSENLQVISKGVKLQESDIYFRLLTLPKKGQLLLQNKVLVKNSTFSQKNITDGLLKYALYHRVHVHTRDMFSFQVFSSQAVSSSHDFRVNIKNGSTDVTVVNKGLTVLEGGSRILTKDFLFTYTAAGREVQYTVTKSPLHGQLRRVNLSNSSSVNHNVVLFTNWDISQERLMYVHDDSETTQDHFKFQILVHTGKQEESTGGERSFNVSVQLVNDHRPERVVDKVFNVTRDGQRLLTLNDLRYKDEDSDFDDGALVYTRRGIPMGDVVLSSDPSHKLYQFTQRDIQQNKVLFVHGGVSYGRFVLFITDGKHYVSTLFEVMAQDPYLHVENNTGLMVQRGGNTNVTSASLSVLTNLDIRDPQEVTFQVFLPPQHGVLCLMDGDCDPANQASGVSTFTQWDLETERLSYHHDGSYELSDCFNVTAKATEKSTAGQRGRRRRSEVRLDIAVPIKIYLESHQRPPTVLTNHPVVVEEGQNVSVTRVNLEVVHEDSRPPDVTFTVLNPPSLGFLQKTPPVHEQQTINGKQRHPQTFDPQQTSSFTQSDVNQGLIIYHQRAAGGRNDSVLLEATNGMTEVGPIVLEIDIVPKLVPLQVSELTLDEGSAAPLTTDLIKVTSHHFSDVNFLYQVLVPPRHGHLEHSRIPGMAIAAFTHTEVERHFISYVHDGSETHRDNFTLVANQTETSKHSLPCTINISVAPVNDQTPVVTANRGLKVAAGSVTEITADVLSAEDADTASELLQFVVTPPSNGHLALKSAPSRHILNFTQAHVQSGRLLFVHSGAFTGGFHFQVNDGVNFAPRQIFSTTAFSLVLTLQKNHPIEVYPGSVRPISGAHLQVVSSDSSRNHSVLFTVVVPPKLGRLLRRLPDNSTQDVSTFWQSMVNDGVILYEQTRPQTVGWSTTDSFTFTASSPPAALPAHNFTILISFLANDHHDSPQHNTGLLNNAGAVVSEGGRVKIDSSKLDASNLLEKVPEAQRKNHHIWYRVISLPQHGTLSVQGRNLTRETPHFFQTSLNQVGVTYVHDDSETVRDSFTFQAGAAPLDSDHRVNDSLMVTETFNITVTPVNDHPPLVRSPTPSMKVVVGERVVLGPDSLQVEDQDTPPEELHYLLISGSNNGYLTLGERPEPVTSFTQYDVNHGRLHLTQQGEASTGVFYFNVTDGHHRPLYKLFTLEVVQPSVSIVNNTGLSLVQGRTAVVLTTNQLAARTNGRSQANISYTVTASPQHGRIAINDQEVVGFCHQDLQFGRVVYHMTDLSESEDTFQISVSASSHGVDYGNVSGQTVKVTVRPLLYLREPIRVPSGIAVKLGKSMMDASELARISRSDPVFEVLTSPKHGKLVKMTYDPTQASQLLKSFTFRDVVQGRVAIEETLSDDDSQLHDNQSALATAGGHAPATPLNDSFTFLLKAGNVQPAKGELHFTIFPHHQMGHGPDGAGRTHATPPRLPAQNKTTSGGKAGEGVGLHPHILLHKANNRTHHRPRTHHRWGNHSRTRDKSGSSPAGPDQRGPLNPPDVQPDHLEVLPRPASDPLLIILPLLACLLLIVILVVLILVFRRRKEKRSRTQLIQQLAAVRVPLEESPRLRGPEPSVAMPMVVVTPLGPVSCPNSPRIPVSPRRRRTSLAPSMTFWGSVDADAGLTEAHGNRRRGVSVRRSDVTRGDVVLRVSTDAGQRQWPTLQHQQFWV